MSTGIKEDNRLSRVVMVKWCVTLLAAAIILFIPTTEIFTQAIRLYLAVTLLAILIFAFELMENIVPAIMLPVAYMMLGIAPKSIAFSPWLTTTPWVLIGIFLLSATLSRTGLLNRVSYKILVASGGTYKGVLIGLFLVGIVLNLFLAGNAIFPLIFICYSLCTALDLKGTKAGAGIMFASCIAGIVVAAVYYNPQGFGLINNIVGGNIQITWGQFFFHNVIFWGYAAILMFVVYFMYKPAKDFQGKAYFQECLDKLGPTTKEEKKAAVILVLLLIYMVTASWHKLGLEWGFTLASCAMFLPGINVGKKEDIGGINLGLVFFVAACLSIGSVAVSLGLGTTLAAAVTPYISANSHYMFFLMIWLITTLLNLLLTPFALMATLPVPFIGMANMVGIPVLPVIYTFMQGLDQVFLPYEAAQWLMMFSFGIMSMKEFAKFASLKVVINLLFIMLIAIPYWKLIGIL